MDKSIKKWSVMAVMMLLFLGVVVMSMRTGMESAKAVEIKDYEKWDKELVDFVAQMPVQDRERLKPVSTWASFKLYGMHASRTVKFTSDGEKVKLSPTEWLLDCMFRPDVADQLPLFKVNDDKVTTALGISTGEYKDKLGNVVYKKKADMYSYNELAVGDFEKELDSERKRIRGLLKEGLKLEGIDAQVSNLIRNLDEYKNLKNMFAANRLIPVPSELDPTFSILKTIEGAVPDALKKENLSPTEIRQANVLTQYILLGAYISKQQNMSPQDRESYVMTTMDRMSQFTLSQLRESAGIELRTMPSLDKEQTRWTSWQYNVFTGLQENDRVTLFEGARGFVRWSYVIDAYDKGDQKEMLVHFKKYQKVVEKRALKRGDDLDAVASEVSFYRADYLFKSLVFFLVGSFVAILMLPSLQSKWGKFVYYCTWALAAAGNLCLLIGVIMRSILMERYPLGNLYDTILFSTFVAVLVLLFIEFVTRRRICIGLAAVIGALGMFLAYSFEVGNATDHMTPLNAVLRSNFWLSTHVTTIIIGYAGGIIASFLAIIALFGRMLGIVEDVPKFNRFMTRIVYGACCFTLLFSLVGTILGGIWANDSWGRFWGWDPKENGALMIVIWFLIILHARMAGYIKEWGLHICAVFGANIVAFSWWGVNFLSTGLHSYGFASGGSGMFWLMVYITFNTVIVFVSLSFAWYEKAMKKQRKRERLATKKSEDEPPVLPTS